MRPHPLLTAAAVCGLSLSLACSALASEKNEPKIEAKVETKVEAKIEAKAEKKIATNLPPSVALHYKIRARQSGIPVSGTASVKWQVTPATPQNPQALYSITTETRAMIVGTILNASSRGHIDAFGLAPEVFTEKRFRKDATTTRFDQATKTIRFSVGDLSYPIKGGEQDRNSATWQLIAMARAAGEQFIPGSEWKMFVAYTRDADPWTFHVDARETVRTPMGDYVALHVTKIPPPDSKDQHVELWLAPALDWYPVRLKFSDADGGFVDQVLESVTK